MTAPTTSYHLRPRSGWLNDPNGMARVDGVWHVFFQHNPHAPVHDRIAWGHATSRDLAHWELQPVAFSPSPGAPDAFGCWTGVFVPGHDRPAVVYSGIADDSRQSTICLRWGSADLRDWGAPIVVGRTPRQDGIAIMRDPFVFEHDGRRLAVLGVGLADGAPAIALFDRSDELSWRYEGILLADDPVLAAVGRADVWECPQLFPLDGRWVLIVSLYDRGVLGGVVAAVGDLVDEGGSLRFAARSAHAVDEGADFYSPQVVAAAGQAPLLMGWIRQDGQDPRVRDHAGCLSLPRRLRLVDGLVTGEVDPGAAGTGDEKALAHELFVGAHHAASGDSQLTGQDARGGQWIARCEAGVGDPAAHVLDDLGGEGTAAIDLHVRHLRRACRDPLSDPACGPKECSRTGLHHSPPAEAASLA